MIIVKFIVLFGCISVISAVETNYCKICSNHTLCQYKIPGPSSSCRLYDSTALLSSKEIQELVQKINARRNFIALGHSTILPPAANMKKIRWSTELERFAQRWADQCDPFLNPDKEDICRDLDNAEVGQNIGSVAGTSRGLNVKSFVEMWFTQILNYVGTVTYYNQSRDFNTNYFTQLIWAKTEFVGCGKVKFYIYERNMTLVRLVCNFAPKGNVNGKPVYAIGYAGTQCANNMVPDKEYQGICDYEDAREVTVTTKGYPVSSLLRVLNLANTSMKQEIDPIRNNLKERYHKKNRQRNQKTRHVTANNSHDTERRMSLRKSNMRKNLKQNMTRNMRNNDYLNNQHEQGDSRSYHGREESGLVPRYITTSYFHGNINPGLRQYEYPSPPVYLISSPNYANVIHIRQCTRNVLQNQLCCNSGQCTRGQHHCCQRSPGCQAEIFPKPILLNTVCPPISVCTSTCPAICPPLFTTIENCHMGCKCSRGAANCCNNIPNMVRSGGHKTTLQFSTPIYETHIAHYDSKLNEAHKIKHERKETDQSNKHLNDEVNEPDPDYFYRSIDSGLKKKRELQSEDRIRPFWKFKDINQENTPELKSLKYTTLPQRYKMKTRRNMQSIIRHAITESITIAREDYSNNENDEDNEDEEKATEKYLSFDELMYLRKLSDNYMDYYPRRQGGRRQGDKKATTKKAATQATDKTTKKAATKATTKAAANAVTKATTKAATKAAAKGATKATTKATTKAATKTAAKAATKAATKAASKAATKAAKAATKATKAKAENVALKGSGSQSTTELTEYTANTPFERVKQCSRKLTCTWTIYTGTAEDGKQLGPLAFGSRTPPGYVEGCTRTSTCTRDHMDRNKMATTVATVEIDALANANQSSEVIVDDDEYCEKRSLNRRNADHTVATPFSHANKDIINAHTSTVLVNLSNTHDYIWNEKIRMKRQQILSSRDTSKVISYADLYYLVLNKMMKSNMAERRNINCLCNYSSYNYTDILFGLFCLLFLFIL